MARILFVNKASFRYPGGAETRIRAVATQWARAGHSVYLLCAKTSVDEPAEAVHDGVTVRCVRVMPDALLRRFPPPHYLPQALFYVVGLPFVLYYMRRWRIDAIRDSMSPFPGLSLLAPWLGRRGLVVLHILFGGYRGWRRFYPVPYALLGALGEWLLLRGWLGYRAVVTDAPWMADYIRERARRPMAVEAIENGVEVEAFPQRERRGRIARLINAARLVEHKGQADLVEACRRLRARGVEFELDLYGSGELEADLRKSVADAGLDGCVHIRPALRRPELVQRLCEYDLYVMPSRSEGLPVVLLEAIAARVPVVVAARPYATTLLDSSLATFYDPDAPEGLANAIAYAIAHPEEAEARADRARAWVERFTWERTAREEWRLLEALLAKSSGKKMKPMADD